MKSLAILSLERILNTDPDDGSHDPIHSDIDMNIIIYYIH